MIRNRMVPTPEKSRVVEGGNPVSSGTRKVAPNIATTCWAPMPMVRGQLSRSCGDTTEPGTMVLPSPWMFQWNADDFPGMLMGASQHGGGRLASGASPFVAPRSRENPTSNMSPACYAARLHTGSWEDTILDGRAGALLGFCADHEFQREALARWTATLFRGGVPRVRIRPRRTSAGQARPRLRRRPKIVGNADVLYLPEPLRRRPADQRAGSARTPAGPPDPSR